MSAHEVVRLRMNDVVLVLNQVLVGSPTQSLRTDNGIR